MLHQLGAHPNLATDLAFATGPRPGFLLWGTGLAGDAPGPDTLGSEALGLQSAAPATVVPAAPRPSGPAGPLWWEEEEPSMAATTVPEEEAPRAAIAAEEASPALALPIPEDTASPAEFTGAAPEAAKEATTAPAPREEPASPAASGRVCPICFEALEPAEGETFCGVHLYCAECANRSARVELRQGRVPRCPDCFVQIEPVAAQRILSMEDLDSYHRLALWSNDGVAVCPRCREGLYADAGEDPGGRCGTAVCPACSHEFCVECRGPAHPDIADCDEAARVRRGRRGGGGRRRAASDHVAKPLPAAPFACAFAATAAPRTSPHNTFVAGGSSMPSGFQDTASIFGALGIKACPRCRAMVEKQDDESCDHMTCAQCKHEFCWSCLADRSVIYAHGNHFHRPSCRFYATYGGPAEYLPDKCRRCAHRGVPCTPPNAVSIDSTAIAPTVQFGSLDTWLRTLVELFTLRSCHMGIR